jgi:hypothetical protein
MNDEDIDWRIEDMGHVASGELAGRRLLLMCGSKHPTLKTPSFVMPNPASLALSIAISSGAMAEALRPRLTTAEVVEPTGNRGFAIRNERLGDLYSFFEQSMVAVTMSFQAVELFANTIIGRRAKGTITIVRKKETLQLNADEAERRLSTDEKLADVLPALMNVSSPKQFQVWQRFKQLKDWRDDTMH